MSMFKKRNRRNIRTRKAEDEEIEEEDHPPTQLPGVVQTSVNTKREVQVTAPALSSKSGPGILSFDDELREEVGFKVKKSSRSERMMREKEREKKMEEREKQRKLQEKAEQEAIKQQEDEYDDQEEGGGVVSIGDQLHQGMVPDATMIHAIRKKREMARKLGVESVDYLPLEKGGKNKGYGKAQGKSRLIREDEHDKSDEEDEDQVMNFGKSNEPGRQMQVLTGLENIASDSEDEETRRWEEEQINKGIKASNQTHDPLREGPVKSIHSLDPLTQSFIYGTLQFGTDQYGSASFGGGGVYSEPSVSMVTKRQQPAIPEKLVPITLETLKSKLANRLDDLKDTHAHHTHQLEQVEKDIETAQQEISSMESKFPAMEGQYAFFQQMKSYVRDLLSCLTVKNSQIKALDQKMMDIRRKRAALLIERRRQDVADEAEECASGGKGITIGPEVEARQRRSVEREGRRRRRRERRQREGVPEHEEGMSSDDEIPETNRLKFVADTDIVNERLKDTFSDVMEDFYRLYVIKTRFEQWKFSYLQTYSQAFVSMCLPKLFSPFVTLQMIQWNPLESGSLALDSLKWFEVLLFYGYQEGVEPTVTDEDNHLIPQIIDKVVLPKLTGLVESVWDPLSTAQTERLVKITNELLDVYCTGHTPHQDDLLTAVRKKLQLSVNMDIFIPLMSSLQLQNSNTHDYLYYQRQFWSAIKLLGNILLWWPRFPEDVLQQLVLDGLVSRYLCLSLQNSPTDKLTVKKTEKLFSLLPSEWFSIHRVSKSRALQSLKRFLGNLLETLKREGMGYPEHLRKNYRILEEKVQELQLIFRTH